MVKGSASAKPSNRPRAVSQKENSSAEDGRTLLHSPKGLPEASTVSLSATGTTGSVRPYGPSE